MHYLNILTSNTWPKKQKKIEEVKNPCVATCFSTHLLAMYINPKKQDFGSLFSHHQPIQPLSIVSDNTVCLHGKQNESGIFLMPNFVKKGPVQFGLLCLKLYSRVIKMAVGPQKFSWMIFLLFRYFWRKKNFFRPPCWCCLTGGGRNLHFGGVSDVG